MIGIWIWLFLFNAPFSSLGNGENQLLFEVRNCLCPEMPAVEEAVAISDGIFSGKVLKLDTLEADQLWSKGESRSKVRLKLKVNQVFKAVRLKEVVYVYSDLGKESCGYRFTEGLEYLIYGEKSESNYKGKSVYYTSKCMRTRMPNLEETEALLDLLKREVSSVCILPASYFKK